MADDHEEILTPEGSVSKLYSDDELPQDPGFIPNWKNRIIYRLDWNPFQTASNFIRFQAKDGEMDSRPIVNHVVQFVYKNMDENGLVDAFDKLQSQFLDLSDKLSAEPEKREEILEQIFGKHKIEKDGSKVKIQKGLLDEFSETNRDSLNRFRENIKSLRVKVKNEFRALPKRDGNFYALSDYAKRTLVEFLDDMQGMAHELQQEDFGGKHTQTGKVLAQLKDQPENQSLVKLLANAHNKLAFLTDQAYQNLNPEGTRGHVREALVHGIAVGYYNPYPRQKFPEPSETETNHVPHKKRIPIREKTSNVEKTVMDGERDMPDLKFTSGGSHKIVSSFITTVYDAAPAEVQTIRTIQRMFDMVGDEGEVMDNAVMDDLDKVKSNDPHFQKYKESIARFYNSNDLGGFRGGPFDSGREGRAFYARQTGKFWEWAERMLEPDTKLFGPYGFKNFQPIKSFGPKIGYPAKIQIRLTFFFHPLVAFAGWLTGSKAALFNRLPDRGFIKGFVPNLSLGKLKPKKDPSDDKKATEEERRAFIKVKPDYPKWFKEGKDGKRGGFNFFYNPLLNSVRRVGSTGLLSRHGMAVLGLGAGAIFTGGKLEENNQEGSGWNNFGHVLKEGGWKFNNTVATPALYVWDKGLGAAGIETQLNERSLREHLANLDSDLTGKFDKVKSGTKPKGEPFLPPTGNTVEPPATQTDKKDITITKALGPTERKLLEQLPEFFLREAAGEDGHINIGEAAMLLQKGGYTLQSDGETPDTTPE